MRFCSLLLALWLATPSANAAKLMLAPDWQLLAMTPAAAEGQTPPLLAPGTHHLLVRYEATLPARVNGDNDETLRSDPVLVTLEIGQEDVTLSPPALSSDKQKRQFAAAPTVIVTTASGHNQTPTQRKVTVDGFQLGLNYQQLLLTQIGQPAMATPSVPQGQAVGQAAVVATATSMDSQAATPLDSQLQQLFLQASPEQRKRFIGWAVQQF